MAFTAPAGGSILSGFRPDPRGALEQRRRQLGDVL
jgi:hypothetical protein